MPQIPTLSTEAYSTAVPTSDINANQFGQAGQASQNLGGQVTSAGFAAGNLASMFQELSEKRKQNEAQTYASNQETADSLSLDEFIRNDKLDSNNQAPAGGVGPRQPYNKGHAERVKDEANRLFTASQDNAETPEARDFYRKKIENSLAKEISSAAQFESEQMVKFSVDSITDNASALIGSYAKGAPKPDTVVRHIEMMNNQVTDNVALSENEKHDNAVKVKAAVAAGYMDSLANSKQYGVALHILEGKDVDHKVIAESIPGPKRLDLIDQFKRAQKVEVEKRSVEFAHAANDLGAQMASGAGYDQSVYQRVKNNLLSGGAKPEIIRDVAELDTQKVLADSRIEMQRSNRKDWGAIASKYESDIQKTMAPLLAKSGLDPASQSVFGQTIIKAGKLKLAGMIESLEKAEEADAATAVMDQDKSNLLQQTLSGDPERARASASAYVTQTLAAQQVKGINNQAILTDPMAKQYASLLKNAETADGKGMILSQLASTWGNNYPTVMKEIVKKGDLPGSFVIAGYSANPEAREAILKNYDKRTEYNENLEKMPHEKKNTLRKEVNDVSLNSLARSGGSAAGLGNDFREAIKYDAMRRISENEDPTVAVLKARKMIVDDQFVTIKSGNSEALFRRDPVMNQEITQTLVKNYMDLSVTEDYLKNNLKVKSPVALKTSPEEDSAYIKSQLPNIYWVQSDDFSGLKLMRQTPYGAKPVYNVGGKEIVKPMKDITNMSDASLEKTANYNNLTEKLNRLAGRINESVPQLQPSEFKLGGNRK